MFAYYQHDEQKLSTVEFRKLYKLVLGRFLFYKRSKGFRGRAVSYPSGVRGGAPEGIG